MAEFDWINKLPDTDWRTDYTGVKYVEFTRDNFEKRAKATLGENIISEFHDWASRQRILYALTWDTKRSGNRLFVVGGEQSRKPSAEKVQRRARS